jgi:hypothetical protein
MSWLRWPRLAALVGALALTLAVAACGGGGKAGGVASLNGSRNPTTTTNAGGSQDPKKLALEFSKCMRAHGVNMPDPQFDSNGAMTLNGGPGSMSPDDPRFKAAQEACKKYMPGGGQAPKPNPQQLQQALKFARCMRAHGVNMPDPNPNNGGGMVMQRGSGSSGKTRGPGPDDPKFKAAQQACQQYMPKGGMVTSSGGGG